MQKAGICLFIFFVFGRSCYASVIINEVYPAPDQGNFEWVELYNDGDSISDLSTYTLTDASGKKLFLNAVFIDPKGYIVATSSGVLNNTGDTLFLKDNNGFIIDKIEYEDNFDNLSSLTRCSYSEPYWKKTTIITKNESNETACFKAIISPTTANIPISPIISLSEDNNTSHESHSPTPSLQANYISTITNPQKYSNIILTPSPITESSSFNKKHLSHVKNKPARKISTENIIAMRQTNTFGTVMLSLFAWSTFASVISFLYSIKVLINRYRNDKEHYLQDASLASSTIVDGDYFSAFLKAKDNSK